MRFLLQTVNMKENIVPNCKPFKEPGIDSQPGRYDNPIYLQACKQHKLAESIP